MPRRFVELDANPVAPYGTRRLVLRGAVCMATSIFSLRCSLAQTPEGENPLSDTRPLQPEDLAFLRAEGRLRKQKQIVKPDGLRTAGEARILATAIDGIILFGGSLSYRLDPKSPGRRHVTEHGLTAVILPPPLPYDGSQLHTVTRWSGWDVRSATELAVTADFGDVLGVRPPVLRQRMVFIRDDGVWKFDRYEQ